MGKSGGILSSQPKSGYKSSDFLPTGADAKVNYLQAEAKILPEESWSPRKGEKILDEAKGKSLVSLS